MGNVSSLLISSPSLVLGCLRGMLAHCRGHIEGPSTVFGTALNYCGMRILGVKPEHPVAVKARACLHTFGGALGAPSWGKFWLSILNVYDWEGNHPVPAGLWFVPKLRRIEPF